MYGRATGADRPQADTTSQTKFGTGHLYTNRVAAPFRNYPLHEDGPWPWMTIAGPQLMQAASLHNKYNSEPIIIVKRGPANPQTNQTKLLDRLLSMRPQLPASLQSALGGTT